jgi:hypothetical protein
MKKGFDKLVATFLAFLILVLPAALSARERRGANLVITLKDGRYVAGELIAVKPDSLLLLNPNGKDESIAVADIAIIRIVRRSKAWQGLLIGFVPGAVGGAVWGARLPPDAAGGPFREEIGAILGGALFGGVAGLVGLAAGLGAGLDTKIDLAGLPDAETGNVLIKLNRRAREPGAYVPKPVGPTPGRMEIGPKPPAHEWTRFRLTWMPGFRMGGKGWFVEEGVVPFRFTEDLPPGEAGPYSSTWYWAESFRPTFSLGRVTLAYQWSRKLAAEIELNVSNYMTDHSADLRFTSTLDGIKYLAYLGSGEFVSSTSLLVGLTFRPLRPKALQPHVIEVGMAAGPAWTRTSISRLYIASEERYIAYYEDWMTVERKRIWTGRARVSYDYHFNRALSMGAYAEYRWLRVDIPSYEVTEELDFREAGDYYGQHLWRITEVTFPARTITMGGFACGLRFSLGF